MTITPTHVYFYMGADIYSNFYKCKFIDLNHNCLFTSTEKAFMFYKALFFGDSDIAKKILESDNPGYTKSLGRQIKNYDDKAWECVRLGYMTYVNYLKFSQNPELKKQLLETGDRILVEASPTDKIWGIGLSEEEAAMGAEWRGRNLLGIALMDVRKLLVDKVG